MALGKIREATFGLGGYQDAQLGFTFDLESPEGSSTDFWGAWTTRSSTAQWTQEENYRLLGEITHRVKRLLFEAKVASLHELKGKPIEILWDSTGRLQSWRILKEVL